MMDCQCFRQKIVYQSFRRRCFMSPTSASTLRIRVMLEAIAYDGSADVKGDVTQYRPVGVLSVFAKIFESILNMHLSG